jgi:hypothetical protein
MGVFPLTDDPNLLAYVTALAGALCLLMAIYPRKGRRS